MEGSVLLQMGIECGRSQAITSLIIVLRPTDIPSIRLGSASRQCRQKQSYIGGLQTAVSSVKA
ncbi:hypothetical protein PILCRDRAFT_571458 [Piloderma croceum F 1598]|uniref:Uncharacterized protein n=1 Tax=Piloderma croceum (strain F 1598) TaxID=765440 RepID=A0A0C3BPI2_PILCF|nr:hypothetical protein PILCRDRAFT_571458 [Piloderma croceum F 1598]